MNRRGYRDYTRLGLNVVFTDHAMDAVKARGIPREDVVYVLQVHDVDAPGDQPHKRELMGSSVRGKIKMVVAVHPEAGEVRVVTIHQEPRWQWQPLRQSRRRGPLDVQP
jgi:hypothetical protein